MWTAGRAGDLSCFFASWLEILKNGSDKKISPV